MVRDELECEVRDLLGVISVEEIMSNENLIGNFEVLSGQFLTKRHLGLSALVREVRRLIESISEAEIDSNVTAACHIRHIEKLLERASL